MNVTETALMEHQATSRLRYAMDRLLHRLRPYIRAYTRTPDVKMPEHKLAWVTMAGSGGYDDSPAQVISAAIEEHPELWAHAIPEECCIVHRKTLEEYAGSAAAEMMADHGAAIVADRAFRLRYEAEERERAASK
jgi:hypothetical protein